MAKKNQAVVDLLIATRDKVHSLLSAEEDQHHQLRIDAGITRLIDQYGYMTGAEVEQKEPRKRGPAKTIAGKAIEKPKPVRTVDTSPKQEQIDELKTKIQGLYDTIETIDTKELVSKYDDMVIRGVARKVHMKVTKDEPKKLTFDFVSEVKKEVIADKERIAKAKEAAQDFKS